MLSFLGSDGSSLIGRISRGAIAHGFSKRGLSHETWLGANVVQRGDTPRFSEPWAIARG
jgi:hypothetical protein